MHKLLPSKKKTLRNNQSFFITKEVRKAIMSRSRLCNKFLKKKSQECKQTYNKQRNLCVTMVRKAKKNGHLKNWALASRHRHRYPHSNMNIVFLKPFELKFASIYLLSKHSATCNMYSCNVSWQHLILLKPLTFDYVPISEMSRSGEQYCTWSIADLHFDLCLFI